MARWLASLGFRVEALHGRQLGKAELDAALLRLRQRAAQADAVMGYFAGHGIELGRQNDLLPSDARLQDERGVRREAVALGDVLAELRSSRPGRVNLVILDACRENPFWTLRHVWDSQPGRELGQFFRRVPAQVLRKTQDGRSWALWLHAIPPGSDQGRGGRVLRTAHHSISEEFAAKSAAN